MHDTVCRVWSCLLFLGLAGVLNSSGCNQTAGYVMNESGKAFYAQGNFAAARREFESAMMDSPENANYAFNVASAMRKQGDLIGAERMLQHALMLDPRHQPAHHEMAALLREQGRGDEAAAHLQEWVATQPYSPEAHVEQAWMQRERGELLAAEQSLRTALQHKPNYAQAIGQLGQIYDETGRAGQAQELYQRSLALNPFQPELRSRQAPQRGPAMAMHGAYPPASAPTVISNAAARPHVTTVNTASYTPQPQGPPPAPQPTTVYGTPRQTAHPIGSAPPALPAPQMQSPVSTAPAAEQFLPPRSFPLTAPAVNAQGGPQLPAANPTHGPLTMSATPTVAPF